MPGKIHYDITDTLEYARHHATLSGIPRVSIQLVSHIVNKHGPERLRLIGWHPIRQRIVSFDASYFSGDYKYDQGDFCQHFGLSRTVIGGPSLRAYVKRKYGRGWRRPLHHARLLLANQLTGGRTFAKRSIDLSLPQDPPGQMTDGLSSLKPGDLVFIVGATWNFDEYLSTLAQQRRENGIAICQFIHDLIPLLASEHVVDNVPEHFTRWLKHLSGNSDYFLTNSQATKADLDTWLAQNGVDLPTGVLPLAHQFVDYARGASSEAAWTHEPIHARIRNAARLPYVLCVGSIESRKNIWTLANVWQRIHSRLGISTPRLIFAGSPGWLREDFDDFIKGTGSLNGLIRILERPSDAELAYLYSRCLFSVFPSYKEGWGLPIGEGMWFGRPVVCSNTSAMPEVGGSLADYIDPTSWETIEAALLKMITDPDYRERRAAEIAGARLRTWSEVADDLWSDLSSLASTKGRATDFLPSTGRTFTATDSGEAL
jgi:glycosyltransferase involved in cell wall biosynthesis